MYILIRIIAGLCVAILLMGLFFLDERDRNKQQQTNKRPYKQIKRNKKNKPNKITIKPIY